MPANILSCQLFGGRTSEIPYVIKSRSPGGAGLPGAWSSTGRVRRGVRIPGGTGFLQRECGTLFKDSKEENTGSQNSRSEKNIKQDREGLSIGKQGEGHIF